MLKKRSFWFWIFFLGAVIKPFHFPDANRYLGAALFGLIVSLASFFILKGNFLQVKYRHYKIEIWLTISLFVLLFFSLFAHWSDYKTLKNFLAYGVGFLIVFSTLPLCWLIFYETQGNRLPGDIIFLVLHLVAILEFFYFPKIKGFLYYFVAADAMRPGFITSLFRCSTIYGSFAALTLIYSLLRLKKTRGLSKCFYGSLIVSAFAGGALCASRNFPWTTSVGLLGSIPFFAQKGRAKIFLLFFGLFFLIGIHVFVYFFPRIGYRYSEIFPYLAKIAQHKRPSLSEFKPRISYRNRKFANRWSRWKRGIELWLKDPWFGIGPGMFRLKSGFGVIHNIHNFSLQILVEGGILTFLILLILLIRLGILTFKIRLFPLYLAILASLMFDNFLDHTMGWTIGVAWMLQPSTAQNES